MNNQDLKLQIDNLLTLIEVEEENYTTALQNGTEFVILQRMNEHIDKLQSDLQIFLDKQSVRETGKLPIENNKIPDE